MVKLIGVILIVSSLVALATGAFIDMNYGSHSQVTGNVVFNIATQPPVPMWGYDYLAGIAFSYSIVSFIMGVMFLARFDANRKI